MKKYLLPIIGLWVIVVLLLLNLFVFVFEPESASAQKDTSPTGRYQISSGAISTGGTTHYTGNYVLDTATGKIFNKSNDIHKQGEFDAPKD